MRNKGGRTALLRLSALSSGVEIDAVDELLYSRVRLAECGGRATIVVRAEKPGKLRGRSVQRGKPEMSRSQDAWGVNDVAVAD